MVTKLQDANIVIEIDEGRAKAELERFRQLLGQQGAAFDREREGEQKKEEGKAKGAIKKEQKGAIQGLSAMGRKITSAINSIKRATLETGIAVPLGLIPGLGAAAPAVARGLVRAAELGPVVGEGLLESKLGELAKVVPPPVLNLIREQMRGFSDDLTKTNAAIQAIGQTLDQVGKVGISLGVAGQTALLNSDFASDLTLGMYNYNAAQIGARRFAYKEGIEYMSKSIGTVMGNVFNQ